METYVVIACTGFEHETIHVEEAGFDVNARSDVDYGPVTAIGFVDAESIGEAHYKACEEFLR